MSAATEPWIGLAFRHANRCVAKDRSISFLTGGPFVHTEIMLADGRGSVRAYAAFDNVSGFTPSSNFSPNQRERKTWTTVRYPLASEQAYRRVYAIILQIIALGLPYNRRDLWQCCIQIALPFEADLDCQNPGTWQEGGVFCSQVALLILRRLRREHLLAIPWQFEPSVSRLIESTNSRGCSPNQLFKILVPAASAALAPKKKT
jgi:hypothetical protein